MKTCSSTNVLHTLMNNLQILVTYDINSEYKLYSRFMICIVDKYKVHRYTIIINCYESCEFHK